MRKAKIFGKSIPVLAIVAIVASAGLVSAALLTYYGKITMTADVQQSVTVDGKDYRDPITYELEVDVPGGETFCFAHWLTNQASVPAEVSFVTSYWPDGDGITTTYEQLESSWTTTVEQTNPGPFDVDISFSMSDGSFTWTFDADTEDGDFSVAEGLGLGSSTNLQLDDSASDPGFYVLNIKDGTYTKHGWVDEEGWHTYASGDLSELTWLTYSKSTGHTEFTIANSFADEVKMMESQPFGNSFCPPAGTVYAGVGYLPSEPKSITEITLESGETVDFIISYSFAIDIKPGTYTITTEINPKK